MLHGLGPHPHCTRTRSKLAKHTTTPTRQSSAQPTKRVLQ